MKKGVGPNTALRMMRGGQAITRLKLALATGLHEETCSQTLQALMKKGLCARRLVVTGRPGHQPWEYYMPDLPANLSDRELITEALHPKREATELEIRLARALEEALDREVHWRGDEE